jgi:hypothetical protein
MADLVAIGRRGEELALEARVVFEALASLDPAWREQLKVVD